MSNLIFQSKIKKFHVLPGIIFGYAAIGLGLYSLLIAITGYGLHPDEAAENTIFLIIFGLCVLPLGIFLSFTYEAIIIDAGRMKYRKYLNIAGMKFGGWEDLPVVEAIKIAPFDAVYTIRDAIRPAFTIKNRKYKVSLFLENENMALVVAITTRKEALEKANTLAAYLNVEVLDYIDPV